MPEPVPSRALALALSSGLRIINFAFLLTPRAPQGKVRHFRDADDYFRFGLPPTMGADQISFDVYLHLFLLHGKGGMRRWEDPAHSRALTDPGLEPGTLQL